MAKRKYKNPYLRFFTLLVVAVLVLGAVNYFRPLPSAQAQTLPITVSSGSTPNLPWPAYGQSALGVSEFGVLATHGLSKPVPIASITKVITALAALKEKPLKAGEQGPAITLSQADVDIYNQDVAQDGSVVRVEVGEQITQRQMLEAMLLPSANNIADSLAVWAFGSINNYINAANQLVKTLGMSQTAVADASGFSAASVSTASDLVKLGFAAMADANISQIVAERSADIPVAGTISNINWLLTSDGFVGIKTGNTNEAGGCFLFASNREVAGQKISLIGAIVGAPNLYTSMLDSRTLADAADSAFTNLAIIHAGQAVATYKSEWGKTVTVAAIKDLSFTVWKGEKISTQTIIALLRPNTVAGTATGSVTVSVDKRTFVVWAKTSSAMPPPSFFWRLLR